MLPLTHPIISLRDVPECIKCISSLFYKHSSKHLKAVRATLPAKRGIFGEGCLDGMAGGGGGGRGEITDKKNLQAFLLAVFGFSSFLCTKSTKIKGTSLITALAFRGKAWLALQDRKKTGTRGKMLTHRCQGLGGAVSYSTKNGTHSFYGQQCGIGVLFIFQCRLERALACLSSLYELGVGGRTGREREREEK